MKKEILTEKIKECMADLMQNNAICNYLIIQNKREVYIKSISALEAYMKTCEISENGTINTECYMAALGFNNKAAKPVFSVINGIAVLSGHEIMRYN